MVRNQVFFIILKSFNVKYEYNNVIVEAEENVDTLRKVTEKFFSVHE